VIALLANGLITAALTAAIKGAAALTDHWIAWRLAALIAAAITFSGWILDTGAQPDSLHTEDGAR
jgi:hypothetical protein